MVAVNLLVSARELVYIALLDLLLWIPCIFIFIFIFIFASRRYE